MKIPPVETELFHVDRPTKVEKDRYDGASSPFPQFGESTQKNILVKTV